MAADFLEDKRAEIAARMQELKPVAEEYERLRAAEAALVRVQATNDTPTRPARTRAAARPAVRAGGESRPARKRGRPKGGGARRAQALELVSANPGITVGDLATRMAIKPNYLYRVLPALAREGLLVRDASGWKAADHT